MSRAPAAKATVTPWDKRVCPREPGGLQAEQFAAARKAFSAEDYVAARSRVVAALDAAGAHPTLVQLEEAGVRSADIVRLKAEAAILRGQPDAALTLLGQDDDPEAWQVQAAAYGAPDGSTAAITAALDALRRGLVNGGRSYALKRG